jgi:hypothetical protein
MHDHELGNLCRPVDPMTPLSKPANDAVDQKIPPIQMDKAS